MWWRRVALVVLLSAPACGRLWFASIQGRDGGASPADAAGDGAAGGGDALVSLDARPDERDGRAADDGSQVTDAAEPADAGGQPIDAAEPADAGSADAVADPCSPADETTCTDIEARGGTIIEGAEHVTCGSNNTCHVTCPAGGCDVSCLSGSYCDVTCGDGVCTVTCDTTGGCCLRCPDGVCRACVGGGCTLTC